MTSRRSAPEGLTRESGFTLLEIIMGIVLVGILLPAVVVPFTGIKDIKKPEYVTQASGLGMLEMEAIALKISTDLPGAGTYTCAAFEAGPPALPEIDCTDPDHTLSWKVETVAANDPDTASGGATFGKKLTLTVTRNDGAISPMDFYAFY